MRVTSVLIACLLAAPAVIASEGPSPRLTAGQIKFTNGHILDFKPYEKINDDPEEALKKGEAVWIKRQAQIVPEWKRVLFIEDLQLYEGALFRLTVYDYAGKKRGPVARFYGDMRLLIGTQRILLAQSSSYIELKESLLLNSDGRLVRKISQPKWIAGFGQSKDGRLFWIATNKWVPDVWPSVVKVYNQEGRLVKTIEALEEGTVKFEYMRKTYTIPVHAPGIPLG